MSAEFLLVTSTTNMTHGNHVNCLKMGNLRSKF